MVTIKFDDVFIVENCKAIMTLKSLGFTDEKIQELYDKQAERDKKVGGTDDKNRK